MRKLTVFNAESAYFYFRDSDFRQSVLGSERLFCDSASLSLALSVRGIAHRRLHGPDFMHRYLSANAGAPVLIIGGSETAHKAICSKYGLLAATCIDRKVTEHDIDELADTIEQCRPKMVFVCLGLRKQEWFTNQLWLKAADLEASIIGVGAAVDFLGETRIRASKTWRALGLEWLPRLVREPRMAPRILRSFIGCLLMLRGAAQLKMDSLKFANSFSPYS